MNTELVKKHIKLYKENFDLIHKYEFYKWRAFNTFQDKWDIDAKDFVTMLSDSLEHTANLLNSSNVFAKRMICFYSRVEPESVRDLFKMLYNENEDVAIRVRRFIELAKELKERISPKKNSFQDHRTISVYLALRYPQKYYLYKFTMANSYLKEINYPSRLIRGRDTNLKHYFHVCGIVRDEISKDAALIELHQNRLNTSSYSDPNFHILTQDVIYSMVQHRAEFTTEPKQVAIKEPESNWSSWKEYNPKDLEFEVNDEEVNESDFTPRKSNHQKRNKRNKIIGDRGELWVMQQEKLKLISLGFEKKIKKKLVHEAVESGDGLGYDIRSLDENGEEILIEVKTTTGKSSREFFITERELKRSRFSDKNYVLYRVYEFNEDQNTGKVIILKGSLDNLRPKSHQYKAKIESQV